MSLNLHLGQESRSTLSEAILIYRSRHGNASYASTHPVEQGPKGAPVIMAGQPLTLEALGKVIEQLASSGKKKASGFQWTHPRLLAQHGLMECWWTPARSRWMHFDAGDFKASMPAMQPPCLWVRNKGQLYVYALCDSERPTPDSPVYQSPYYNVYLGGNVCQGSMPNVRKLSLDEVEDAFFASVFTHPNPGNRKLTRSRLGNAAFWSQRLKAGTKSRFPLAHLIPMNMTIGELLEQLRKH